MGLSSDGVLRSKRHGYMTDWLARGMVEMRKPADGGKPRWFVREDAHPDLARVKFPEQLAFDLSRLTDAQRKTVNDRLRLVKLWEEQRAAGVKLGLSEAKITANFLDRLLVDENRKLSRATLFIWLAGYRREGVGGLVDSRWKAQGACSLGNQPDPFLEEVRRLYLSLRRPKLTVCHEIALLKAQEKGWEPRSYKTCQRFIESIPRAVVLKMRFGDEAYTNDAEPFIEKDYSSLASNEIWCGDHHQFDVFVKAGERLNAASGEKIAIHARPWLTAWMDERSRKIVGWHLACSDPNSDAILAALRHGIAANGVPADVRMDNGKDYDSYALNGRTKMQRRKLRLGASEHALGVFAQLGIGTKHVQPYHGQSKPIERFFGTLEDRFGRTWETYFGNKPENRPEDFQAKLDAGRAPSFEDFAAAFELWLSSDYHARAHGGDGMEGKSPDQVFAENLAVKRTTSNDLLDLLLLRPTRPVKVQQNGVSFNGLRFGQFEPALQQLLGKQVVLRIDPGDLSRVSVWTIEGRFVCLAPANQKIPANADAQLLRQAIAEKRRHRQHMKEHSQIRPRLSEDLPDTMLRAAMNRNRAAAGPANGSTPPPSLKPIRSPLESQLPAVQTAYDRPRIAVGAEAASLSFSSYSTRAASDEDGGALGDICDYMKFRPSEDSHD